MLAFRSIDVFFRKMSNKTNYMYKYIITDIFILNMTISKGKFCIN
ncbi:hypothetical protein SARI_01504 [Salmonella enterica subsp. arizonae serovar 62:z4,z23:-]|uniref:Uncharacterized protein n=1 Tax=Salmonella arizonae (strain ATCC BAA-731 / CDC346-86 / RSK2980) TaxID=41514 RepID=A9MRU7_SALAR|nr:hypothetical protein SARI_01504 [Salmonella enterica subsp. arizonae serovar 62:z4,z23:-]